MQAVRDEDVKLEDLARLGDPNTGGGFCSEAQQSTSMREKMYECGRGKRCVLGQESVPLHPLCLPLRRYGVTYPIPRRPSPRRPSSPRLGMDNQAFRSSRDSNLSSEATSPYHGDTIITNTTDPKTKDAVGSPQLDSQGNEFLEIEKGINVELKDMLGSRRRSKTGSVYKELIDVNLAQNDENDLHLDGVGVTVSGLPLIDALQMCSNPHPGSVGPLVPPRRRSRDGAEKMRETKVVVEELEQITPEIKHNHHSSYHNTDLEVLPPPILSQDVKYFKEQSTRCRTSRSVQVWPPPPYRLRVLPRRTAPNSSWRPGLGLVGRWVFCQAGLGTLLLLWALAGAAAFRYTEGPREDRASQEMIAEQKFLVNGLMSELMQSDRDETQWRNTIESYMSRHEGALSSSTGGAGGGAGGGLQGRVWSLPGCALFAVSLITTLGFGAPVPRTSEGRAVAVVFAAVGIPLHLLLVLNIGMVIAVKLQTFAHRNTKSDGEDSEEDSEDMPKNEDKLTEITRRSNGLTQKHRRSGSEPIGRQAITNISREANFIISDSTEPKYFHITDTDVKSEAMDTNNTIDDFLPNPKYKNQESRYNICTYKSLQKLDKADRKIFKDIGSEPNSIPAWLKWLPFVGIAIYYTMGVLFFGFARSQPFLDSLMFPLDFTVAGGVAMTSGYIRVLYAIYLELAVVLAATTVSILQVSATQGFTDLGLKFGLLTNSR